MDFSQVWVNYRNALLFECQHPVEVGQWHSEDVSGNRLLKTAEAPNAHFIIDVPKSIEELVQDLRPNLPWAEAHFLERVGGNPVNPPPSHEQWPWKHDKHQDGDRRFSHTYPERMWPKGAGEDDGHFHRYADEACYINHGVRYEYGDLIDLIELLVQHPLTRQAYIPIYFPEDTGLSVRHPGTRIPCSLGYHFMVRQGRMQLTYYMRSCDFVRHFNDDIYLAARLLQWVCAHVNYERIKQGYEGEPILPGKLYTHIASLHCMLGDEYKLKAMSFQDCGRQ